METNLPKERKRGRPKRLMDAVVDNLKVVGLIAENAMVRERWKRMICCGHPRPGRLFCGHKFFFDRNKTFVKK